MHGVRACGLTRRAGWPNGFLVPFTASPQASFLLIEFLLTEKQPPWEEPAGSERRVRGWRQAALDLEDFDGYWQWASEA